MGGAGTRRRSRSSFPGSRRSTRESRAAVRTADLGGAWTDDRRRRTDSRPPPARSAPVGLRTARRGPPTLYLVPAFIVMGIITFYPLLFQVCMSLHRLRRSRNLRPGAAAPPTSSASTTTPRSSRAQLGDPELRLPPAAPLQPVVGALERRHPPRPRRRRSRSCSTPRASGSASVYRALFIIPVVIPPIIVATVWREHVRPGQRRRSTCSWRASARSSGSRRRRSRSTGCARSSDPDPVRFPLPLAFFALLADEHLARLAAERGRRDRRAPEHPE